MLTLYGVEQMTSIEIHAKLRRQLISAIHFFRLRDKQHLVLLATQKLRNSHPKTSKITGSKNREKE